MLRDRPSKNMPKSILSILIVLSISFNTAAASSTTAPDIHVADGIDVWTDINGNNLIGE
jgi:hypothetical protein